MKGRFTIAMVAACPFPYPRGTPIRIFRMAEALSRRGHDVHVVTYHLGETVAAAPFHIHRTPEVKTYRKYAPGPTYQKLLVLDTLLTMKLFHVVQTMQIDIIHAHHYEGLLAASWLPRWMKLPVVYDAHTLLESELPFYTLGLPKPFKQWIGRRIDRWLPKRAAHIITVTNTIRNKIIRNAGVTPEDITMIMNGVECEHFHAQLDENPVLQPKTKIVVFTGNLSSYQRIDLLLKMFREVVYKRQDVRLLIVSDSPFTAYEPLAHTLGIREYIDIVQSNFKELPTYLARADVAVTPRTECDGMPQKLLNYMAASKPIVSFAGAAPILEHKKTGWVVENENIMAFAEGVLQLLECPLLAQQLGANAWQHVTTEYSWDKTAQKTEAVYAQLLQSERSSAATGRGFWNRV